MIVGHRYRVDIEDCCLHVHFLARLVKADLGEDWWTLEWDNGVQTGTYPNHSGYVDQFVEGD